MNTETTPAAETGKPLSLLERLIPTKTDAAQNFARFVLSWPAIILQVTLLATTSIFEWQLIVAITVCLILQAIPTFLNVAYYFDDRTLKTIALVMRLFLLLGGIAVIWMRFPTLGIGAYTAGLIWTQLSNQHRMNQQLNHSVK